jgi:LacI family transcriptional regulator
MMYFDVLCSDRLSGGSVINSQNSKKIRPGIVEVATAAKVSTATVDRVLNNRGGVREATVRRVMQAAEELGYVLPTRQPDVAQTTSRKLIFLLPTGTNPYLQQLAALIRSEDGVPSPFNVRCDCHFVKGFDPVALADAIKSYRSKGDGLAVMGIEHPVVREAINQVSKKGTPVVTIVSDVSHCERAAFVGLDNRGVGRTAAYLLARFCECRQGEVALIAGSLSYLAHNEREMGFLSLMEESFPGLHVVGVREGHDDFMENYQLTVSLLQHHPNLIGIYNIGGSSGGIANALREAGKADSVVLVGHGLSEDTRALLIDGTMDIVISQDPVTIVQNVCHIFSNIYAGLQPENRIPEIAMRIIFKENLPLR